MVRVPTEKRKFWIICSLALAPEHWHWGLMAGVAWSGAQILQIWRHWISAFGEL